MSGAGRYVKNHQDEDAMILNLKTFKECKFQRLSGSPMMGKSKTNTAIDEFDYIHTDLTRILRNSRRCNCLQMTAPI